LNECAWCLRSGVELTSDHVFPRCIGGTLELSIPACRPCQALISKAERELARRSMFALYRIAGAPPPRRRNQAGRRVIEAKYVLVKDAGMGGYQEVAMRVNDLPVVLPSIEVDLSGEGGARLRGVQPIDVAQVAEALRKAFDHQPDPTGLVATFDVKLLERHDQFYEDPDFWPRVYLDLAGELHIRARTPEEATALIKCVVDAAQRGVFNQLPGWNVGVVEAGTVHHFAVEYDETKVHRVVAKIPAGIAVLGGSARDELRRYVIGDPGAEGVRVEEFSPPGSPHDAGDHHLAVVYVTPKSLRAAVVLYGGLFVVRVGAELEPSRLLVAKCRVAGGSTRFVEGGEADEIVLEVRRHAESLGVAW